MGSRRPPAQIEIKRRDAKEACRCATTGAIANLSAAPTSIDGVGLAVGDRILVKDGASPDGIAAVAAKHNGIYEVATLGATSGLIRAGDANSSGEVTNGIQALIAAGTVNSGKIFYLSTSDPIVLNTTSLTFINLADAVGQTFVQEEHLVTAGENTAGQFNLAQVPSSPSSVRITVAAGLRQSNAAADGQVGTPDFESIGQAVKFNAASTPSQALSGDIGAGDELIIEYAV